MMRIPEYICFISLIADKNVGKKSLRESSFVNQKDIEDYGPTLGFNLFFKEVEAYGGKIRFNLIMFNPDKHFERLQIIQVKNSDGIILLYDITNRKSLEWLSRWSQIIKTERKDYIPILLVGNKIDLEEEREVSKEQIEKFKDHYDISSSIEVSLKTGENIEEMFMKLFEMIMKKKKLTRTYSDYDSYQTQ